MSLQVPIKVVYDLEDEIERLQNENKRLQAWKDSALAVEATWDEQAVGRALNVGLGQSIRDKILPSIKNLRTVAIEDFLKLLKSKRLSICDYDGYGGTFSQEYSPINQKQLQMIVNEAIQIPETKDGSEDNHATDCICVRDCDCQNPTGGGVSNECPVHNMTPYPNPECRAEKHWFE